MHDRAGSGRRGSLLRREYFGRHRRIGAAGELLDIEVLDHLVIGHQRWTSLARRGVLMQTETRDRSLEKSLSIDAPVRRA